MDPAKMMSLIGKKKMSQMQRGFLVRKANGVNDVQNMKHSLSAMQNMSTVDRYHTSKGTSGSIINKALGGRFGPVR